MCACVRLCVRVLTRVHERFAQFEAPCQRAWNAHEMIRGAKGERIVGLLQVEARSNIRVWKSKRDLGAFLRHHLEHVGAAGWRVGECQCDHTLASVDHLDLLLLGSAVAHAGAHDDRPAPSVSRAVALAVLQHEHAAVWPRTALRRPHELGHVSYGDGVGLPLCAPLLGGPALLHGFADIKAAALDVGEHLQRRHAIELPTRFVERGELACVELAESGLERAVLAAAAELKRGLWLRLGIHGHRGNITAAQVEGLLHRRSDLVRILRVGVCSVGHVDQVAHTAEHRCL